jgi:hypothetical protein
MTFTYNLTETDDLLLISKVRLELGDTVSGSGVRPNGVNLSDEEILSWLEEEENDIQRTVGRAALALSNMWASAAVSKSAGPFSVSYGKISDAWAKRASAIQAVTGGVAGMGGLQSSTLRKVDGYSENNSSPSSEYTP